MARFDVYTNPDAGERKLVPYLLDVQNDFLRAMDTRVVIPLWSASAFRMRIRDLNPELTIDQNTVVMDTASVGAMLRHYAEDKKFIYSLDIKHLDEMRKGR